MISLDFMDRVEMFKDLSDEQLKAIQETGEIAEYRKGECIFRHGDPADHLWVVIDGEVELRCESGIAVQQGICEPVAFVSQAQTFGWTCFVPPHQYRLSGYCASRHCRLLKFEKTELERLFEKYPEIGFAVMQYTIAAIGKQFQELQDEIARRRGQEIMSKW
ncbi:MAG: cyclic nucleotide-binding domain-containing protein [Desulfobacteraceae bacterium]|nr:cyclic nucleotide-binding domain-containing protein [Desulfobacteraceae bacterium]MCF8095810.1 cyclic nucleotide-binding domain-containing protein [Desulfobacteraceae bacterium]